MWREKTGKHALSNGHKEYPHLRFHAENGENYPDLESYSMGELYTERKEAGEEGLPILSVSIHTGVSDGELDESETTKRVKRIDDKSLYRKADTGDLVFNMMRAWQGALGVVKTAGMVSPAYIVAKPNEKVYPPYVDYYVKTDNMVNQIHRLSYGVTDFRLRLYWTSFQAVKCRLPVKQEQKHIADFLKKLDERIEKQRELVENLKKYKRGLLHEILCEKIKITKSAWNVYKIGDYLRSKNIKQLPTPDAPLMAFTATGGVCDKGDRYDRGFLVKDASTKLYKRTDLNDFIYSSNNLDVGSIGLNLYGSAVISDVYEIFSISGADPWFISEAIRQKPVLHQILKYRQGCLYGQYRIYAEDFLEVSIRVPPLETQKQIGTIFSRIEYRIKSEQTLLNCLENAKKYFLQQLFI